MQWKPDKCEVYMMCQEGRKKSMKCFVMDVTSKQVDCGVVEWVKLDILRWSGYVMRLNEDDFVKKYENWTEEGFGVSGSVVGMRTGDSW